jgi:hypothetical protein
VKVVKKKPGSDDESLPGSVLPLWRSLMKGN